MGEGLYKTLSYAVNCFLDIVFPKPNNCGVCRRNLEDKDKYFLCPVCMSKLIFLDFKRDYDSLNPKIPQESGEAFAFDKWIAVCLYEGEGREMVHKLKYNEKRELSIPMAALIYKTLEEQGIEFDLIVPVPLSKKRLKKRGYNQAELIARELSNLSSISTKSVLSKIKDTTSQVLYNAEDRWYNVKDAFSCETALTGKTVILIDDIITTGATVHYCARELKLRGAKTVYAVSFAKSSLN